MEQRRVLSADPVIAAVTYLEGDAGQDTTPDHFEVSFQGGLEATQLTQFTINGDQDSSGDISDGDVFFDATDGTPGTGGHHEFIFDAANSRGVSASDITSTTVSADGLLLSVEVNNFEAGDVLAFTIDVDEVERFRVDKIASGVEFEASLFNATFVDPHHTFEARDIELDVTLSEGFVQGQFEGFFFDEYNQLFDEAENVTNGNIDLTRDNEEGFADRTAGAIDAYNLVPKPVTIGGTIYQDDNLNCEHDSDESGIGGVTVELQKLNETTGEYETVATTTTDEDGRYEFGEDLGITPGIFQLVETQPDGFLDVGSDAGSEGGTKSENVISGINIPLGGTSATDYDFKEVRPASLSGKVWHDENNDGVFDANEKGIANVLIEVTRVGAKSDVTEDPFANTDPIFVRTDANGCWEVDALPPGVYQVVEVNEYPGEVDPLAAYLDGKDSIGNIDGVKTGDMANDKFTNIVLCAGDDGVNYDFGEVLPAEICGTVWHDQNDDGTIDANEDRIGGVTIELFDKDGTLIAQTVTDANGDYCFKELFPGDYLVKETQPEGFTDGKDSLGQIGGLDAGEMTNDEFCVKLDSGDKGTNYDFGELKSAKISGTVYEDDNDNGVQDAGEKPIAGVTIELFDKDGNLLAETLTDANGDYCFADLAPGDYVVKETQPNSYIDGKDTIGQIDGVDVGEMTDDMFCVHLESGDEGVNYDFGELKPAKISGTVYEDDNNNGVQDDGEEGIAGVTIELFDKEGNLIAETLTDANGDYCFGGLGPGDYLVKETQPNDFIDGKDSIGQISGLDAGEMTNDAFCVKLEPGDEGVNYDFGEVKHAQICGTVYEDTNNNGVQDEGEAGIAGTRMVLTDNDGNIIAETFTDSSGDYCFTDLLPGTYCVKEIQPEGFFDGIDTVGEIGGVPHGELANDEICEIELTSGEEGEEYNFGETPPAEIHGRVWEDGPAITTDDGTPPENYRTLRDGVYQSGIDTPLEGVKMELYWYVDPTSGTTTPRPVTLSEVDASEYSHMGTTDPDAPVWVETMDNGEYWFLGLQPGNYVVLENQPDGFFDSNDAVGTTTGFTYNSPAAAAAAPANILTTFSNDQIMDAVVAIKVEANGVSEANNFSEVRVLADPPPEPDAPINPPGIPASPQTPGNPRTPGAGITGLPGLLGSQPSAFTQFIGNSRGASFQTQADPQPASDPYTWHLSVVNGGLPRGTEDGTTDDSVWLQAGYINNADWNQFDMDDAVWTFTETVDDNIIKNSKSLRFGMFGGIPLAGDFDGDGTDEVAVFKDGYWMIDINRNGRWDETDLLAKLGDEDDRPVVGDWDGDGKDDIGIYGPIWERDREAIDRDPGLPNPDNSPFTKPKNVPPTDSDATSGARIMKLTSYGKQRADVVDHVFGVGEREEIPVTGDWNGNGVRSIGTFQDGSWKLDVNGDGRFDHEDEMVEFGQAGDIPLVGDFNGDGVEEIAVYRSGTWMIDIDGNRELTATDKTFEMGGELDKPVVGDWDGDGVDEPALYSQDRTQEFN